MGYLVEDDRGGVFLRDTSTMWSSAGSRALAALVSELLEGEARFDEPPIGLGPQAVYGEPAEVPKAAACGRDWVATTLLSARAA